MLKIELLSISPSSLILHELHPAYDLHMDIRNRLSNGFLKNKGKRFSRQTILQMVELRPLIVTGTQKAMTVISGWNIFHILQLYNIDEHIPCIFKKGVSESNIKRIAYQDFYFMPQTDQFDEVSQRVRAILMSQIIDDPELKDLLFIDSLNPKDFFNLPTHKGNRLQKSIQEEPGSVKDLITSTSMPLGAKENAKEYFSSHKKPKPTDVAKEVTIEKSKPKKAKAKMKSKGGSSQQSLLFSDGKN